MKIYILTLFLTLSTVTLVHADRFTQVTINFRDGSTKFGLGRTTNSDKIIFIKEIGADKEYYNHITVESIYIVQDGNKKHLIYKIVKDTNNLKVKLLEQGIDGKICTYYDYKAPLDYGVKSGVIGGFGGVTGVVIASALEGNTEHYIAKKGEDNVIKIKTASNIYSKKFKKIVETYFTDCSLLMEKYKFKDFHKEDFESVINFYNYRCNQE